MENLSENVRIRDFSEHFNHYNQLNGSWYLSMTEGTPCILYLFIYEYKITRRHPENPALICGLIRLPFFSK